MSKRALSLTVGVVLAVSFGAMLATSCSPEQPASSSLDSRQRDLERSTRDDLKAFLRQRADAGDPFNMANLYTDADVKRFKKKLEGLSTPPKTLEEAWRVLGMDPKRVGLGYGGGIIMNRNDSTWPEVWEYPLSKNYLFVVSTNDRSRPGRDVAIKHKSQSYWRPSTQQASQLGKGP